MSHLWQGLPPPEPRSIAFRPSRSTTAVSKNTSHLVVDELLASPMAAEALRERLYLAVQVLDGVRRALHEAVSAGEVAQYRALLAAEGLAER